MPEVELTAAGIVVGQAVARDKLERAKELRHASTRAERALWRSLRGNQLEGLHFRRQQVVDGLILDLYCHSARLAVEVDGGVHEGQIEYDEERARVLALRGIRVLRVRNEQVEAALPSVLGLILEAAGASARSPENALQPPTPVEASMHWTSPHPGPLPEGEGRDGGASPLPASRAGAGGPAYPLPAPWTKADG